MNNKKIFLIFLLSTTSLIYTQELENVNLKELSPEAAFLLAQMDQQTTMGQNIPEYPDKQLLPDEETKQITPDDIATQEELLPIKDFSSTDEIAPIDTNLQNNQVTEIKKREKQEVSSANMQPEAERNIYLNFENAELANFINYISEIKNINLIPDKSLEGVKISLTIREPLTIDRAWNVFLTVLEMANFSIIKNGDVYIIIPKNNKAKQPLPAFINVPANTLPDSDENIRYVTFLENIDVGSIQELLKGMLSAEAQVIPYPDVNGFIITDKSYNIKAAMKVIHALDQTGLQESVTVLKLKRINAIDVKKLFEEGGLLGKSEGLSQLARLLGKQAEANLQYFSSTTRIIAEERTNSLILLGTKNSIDKIVDFVVNHIDTQLKEVVSPLHIYELQYTDAEQIKNILTTVTDISILGEQAQKYGAIRDGVKYFKAMKFEVDKDGNRLIVSSTDKQDWSLLEKTIKDLDKPQPQVALETMFVTVSASDKKALGGAIRNKKSGEIGKHINFQSPSATGVIVKSVAEPQNILGNMLNAVSSALGTTIISFGPDTNLWAVFDALSSQSNTSILTQPFLTVANKTKGHIEYGNTSNVVMETVDGVSAFSGYKEIEAITKIDITPQINVDGIIRLTIDIDITEFIDPTAGSKDVKKIKTDVTVANGQVIALGGFIKSKISDSYFKTPILGDIPVLGWFFKYKKKTFEKNYIFMFISPTIIKPRSTPGTNHYAKMKLEQARNSVDEVTDSGDIKDPIDTWFFSEKGKKYSNKIVDFANGKHQPTTVDIKNDPYYRSHTQRTDDIESFEDRATHASNVIALNKKPNSNKILNNLETNEIPINNNEKILATRNTNTKKRFNLKSRRDLAC